jgi:chromosome segregation ATPase
MALEISGYTRALNKSQEEGENLAAISRKLESDMEYVKKQIATVNEQRDKLQETYNLYSKCLDQADAELAKYQKERRAIQLELNAVQKSTATFSQEIQSLEREYAEKLQNQSSLEKGAKGTQKDVVKLKSFISEKEQTIANVDNNMSTIHLEVLSLQEKILTMKTSSSKIDGEISQLNELIEKYELDIKKSNDELAKKSSEIDSLNKKFVQITGGNENGHMGTLEATIHNISKSIQQKNQDCAEIQKFWLKAQNEMVQNSIKSNQLSEDSQSLRIKLTVLNRKKMVLNSNNF